MSAPAQATYDRLAPDYDRRWAYYTEATLRATLDGLELRPGERLLDLAAGTGELARRLTMRWPELHIVGLDISRRMLSRALRKLGDSAFEAVEADSGRIPFAAAAFHRVLCSNSFHHFTAPAAALAEALRVMRPGGVMVLTDWCDDYLTCKLCSIYLRVVDRSFHRAYRLADCRQLVEAAGFEILSARRFKIDWLWGLMRLEARRPA